MNKSSKHLEESFKKHISYLRRKQSSPRTIEDYTNTYARFIRQGFTYVADDTVEQYLRPYTNPSSYNKILAQFWSFASRTGVKGDTLGSLTLEKQQVNKSLPPVIPDSESAPLLTELEKEHITSWAVINLMRNTGLRIGEAVSLRSFNYFEPQAGVQCIRFVGKGQKERIVPLNKEAHRAFDIYVAGPMINQHTVREHVRRAARKVGITRLKPHWFRHTIATKLRARGRSWDDIADLLGNSAQVVKDFYGRMDYRNLSNMVSGI